MKIEIKNRFTGSVIFELDIENNSIALTLKAAIESNVNLSGAILRWADLHGADLSGANLSDANLYNANLHGANLHGANLRNAELYGVNLHNANLRNTDLHNANLQNCIGNKRELKTLQVDTYSIAFTESILQIGCKHFTHKEWENFTDDEITKMDSGALRWWKKWKDFVFKVIELSFCEQVQA